MSTPTEDQVITDTNIRTHFNAIVNAMHYFAENPKGEIGFWGQPIDLYKKSRKIREKKLTDKDYTPVQYRNKRGRPVKFEKYKQLCESEIIHRIKKNPEIVEYTQDGKTIADYAMDADMYQVFCVALQNSTLPKLIKTTETNVFMRAIINDKSRYYPHLLQFPELIVDQDIHGRTALNLAIQNALTDDFIKQLITADARLLTLLYQKENPAMLMFGISRHIQSGVVFQNPKRDQMFVSKYFDYIMSATINCPDACVQTDEEGHNIAQILIQNGYTQFNKIIAKNPYLLSAKNKKGTDLLEFIQSHNNRLGKIAERTYNQN